MAFPKHHLEHVLNARKKKTASEYIAEHWKKPITVLGIELTDTEYAKVSHFIMANESMWKSASTERKEVTK